jgi:beta-glucosidase/6-phospho-beta-glucosidase/beta-galactosidase
MEFPMPGDLRQKLANRNIADAEVINALTSDPRLSVRLNEGAKLRSGPLSGGAIGDLSGALRAGIEAHPAMTTHRAFVAVAPVFGNKRDAAMAQVSGSLLAEGLIALLDSGPFTDSHVDALVQIAFSADAVSDLIRKRWVGDGLPGAPGMFGGVDIPPLPPRLANACIGNIRGAIARLGAEVQQTLELVNWARLHPVRVSVERISELVPARGCEGENVRVRGSRFGNADPNIRVAFTGANGRPLLVPQEDIRRWGNREINVTAPRGVATGSVGLMIFPPGGPQGGNPLTAAADLAAVVGECLGAAGEAFRNSLSRYSTSAFAGLPELPLVPGRRGDPNWFTGGRPIIHSFTVDGAPSVSVSPGDIVRLAWDVENADLIEIVPVRSANPDRNQLPTPAGTLDPGSGTWTSPQISCDWPWTAQYEIRARNSCSGPDPTTAQVSVLALPTKPNFLWGVALAAGQYEANLNNDWTAYAKDPNSVGHMTWIATRGSPPADITHFEPSGEALRHDTWAAAVQEVGRAKAMGLSAYRLSLEWSRLEPTQGNFSSTVMDDLYLPLLRAIRTAGMEPVVTLHHLTNPLWVLTPPHDNNAYSMLEDSQFRASLRGWENSVTVDAFVHFVTTVVGYIKSHLGRDAPTWWITLNEPVGSIAGAGYAAGLWPPGFTLAGPKVSTVYENLLKAHVRARLAIRSLLPDALVGVAQNIPVSLAMPGDAGGGNQGAATQTEYFYVWHSFDAWHKGTYDADFERRPASRTNVQPVGAFFGIPAAEWQPSMDFAGVNYYRSWWVAQDWNIQTVAAMGFTGGHPSQSLDVTVETAHINDLSWRVDPGSLLGVLRRIHTDYGLPILITENGMPDKDDVQRPGYTVAHTDILRRARDEGIDIRGYLHWSVTDNWEWHMSYQPESSFGLYKVDRTQVSANRLTLPRRPTESALLMSCLSRGLSTLEAGNRFGSFSDDGSAYVVPTKSACRVWTGVTLDGTVWRLLLSALTGGHMLGWLRDSGTTRWVALEELSGSLANGIAGAHRRGWGIPEREIHFTSTGSDLDGTVTILGSAQQNARLTLDPFVGTWLGGPWPIVIHSFGAFEKATPTETTAPGQPASPYVGRWLEPYHPKLDGQWRSLEVLAAVGGAIELRFSGFAVAVVSANGGMLTGLLRRPQPPPGIPLSTIPFTVPVGAATWMRAPDDLD